MAVQPAARNAVQLNPYLLTTPTKEAASLNRKAFAVKLLATITTVAIVAIVGAVLAVSLGLGATTGALPFILLGLAIATPFMAMAVTKLRLLAGGMFSEQWVPEGGYVDQAKIEKAVADELTKISNWTGADVQQFFAQKNWSLDHLPMDALRLLNRQDPLKALLPLIARYNFCSNTFTQLEGQFREAVDKRYADPRLGLGSRNVMNYIREKTAIPFLLDAAVISQVIQNPTLQIRSHREFAKVDYRLFDLREMARRYDQNDIYLTFKDPANPEADDPARAPITLAEVEQDLTPEALRQKLFPAAVRV